MRHITLFLMLLTLSSFTGSSSDFSLIGTWEASEVHENLTITSDNEGFSTWKNGDEVMGGKKFEMDGALYQMTYTTDMTMRPYHVDFIMTALETKKARTMQGIFEVISNDEIRINMDETERPTDFEDGGIMKRVK